MQYCALSTKARSGAVHIQGTQLVKGTPPVPGLCPDEKQLAKIVNYLGLTHNKRVILYDDEGGGWAGRMAWSLDLMGFNNWCYLNGGIVPWIKEGFPTESSANQPVVWTPIIASLIHRSKLVWMKYNDSLRFSRFCYLGRPKSC